MQLDEDLSANLALKLGLRGSLSAEIVAGVSSIDQNATGNKSGKHFINTIEVVVATKSFKKDVLVAPNLFPDGAKTEATRGNQDSDDNLHLLSSSPSPWTIVRFLRGCQRKPLLSSWCNNKYLLLSILFPKFRKQ